jgi:hypothetical protein
LKLVISTTVPIREAVVVIKKLMPPIKGSKIKPGGLVSEEKALEFIKKDLSHSSINKMKVSERDKLYLSSAFNALVSTHDRNSLPTERPKFGFRRYSPLDMFDNCVKYIQVTIDAEQPLTITGMGLFMALERKQIFEFMGKKGKVLKEHPEYAFVFDFASFIEMYNEYAAHKKLNPAGPIFILKNFGWKDKFEIEATATRGALTDEEREEIQRRMANISELSLPSGVKT